MRRVRTFFIAELIRFVVVLAPGAGTLKIVGQQLGDNSIIRANALGPLTFHVDHKLCGFVVGCGPMALLCIDGGHKSYDTN
jgi:hypothetical protein